MAIQFWVRAGRAVCMEGRLCLESCCLSVAGIELGRQAPSTTLWSRLLLISKQRQSNALSSSHQMPQLYWTVNMIIDFFHPTPHAFWLLVFKWPQLSPSCIHQKISSTPAPNGNHKFEEFRVLSGEMHWSMVTQEHVHDYSDLCLIQQVLLN